MSLSKYEKETVINFNTAESIVYLSTSQDFMKRKIKRLAEQYPDDVKIKFEDAYTVIAELPKKYIKVGHPRRITEEQRIAASERLKKYRENKK